MITALAVYYAAKDAGITLTLRDNRIVCRGSKAAVQVIQPDLSKVRDEMICVINGDYLAASQDLILRETVAGLRREELANQFDATVAEVRRISGCSFDDAFKVGYKRLCDAIEASTTRTAAPSPLEASAA